MSRMRSLTTSMNSMEINFTNTHSVENIEPEISALAEKKVRALKKYLRKGSAVSQVYVEFGKVSEAHQKGNIWRTQINLDHDGRRYHADATRETIQESIGTSVRELEHELQKAKQQRENIIKRGGAALKSIMKGFKS